jgi:hypothetical protein
MAMSGSSLTVHWATPCASWLQPVADSLEAVAAQCTPPTQCPDITVNNKTCAGHWVISVTVSQGTLDVEGQDVCKTPSQVKYEHALGSQSWGSIKPYPELALVANTPLIRLCLKPVLRTPPVGWLRKKQIYSLMMTVLFLMLVILFIITEIDVYYRDIPISRSRKRWQTLAMVLVALVLWFLIFHRIPLSALRATALSFTSVVLLANTLAFETARLVNRMIIANVDVAEVVLPLLVSIPAMFFVANTDALLLRRSFKMLLVSVFMTGCAYRYYHLQCVFKEFANPNLTLGESSISSAACHRVALATTANMLAFLAKVTLSYLRGKDFATMTTHFHDLEEHEAWGQRRSRRSRHGVCLCACAWRRVPLPPDETPPASSQSRSTLGEMIGRSVSGRSASKYGRLRNDSDCDVNHVCQIEVQSPDSPCASGREEVHHETQGVQDSDVTSIMSTTSAPIAQEEARESLPSSSMDFLIPETSGDNDCLSSSLSASSVLGASDSVSALAENKEVDYEDEQCNRNASLRVVGQGSHTNGAFVSLTSFAENKEGNCEDEQCNRNTSLRTVGRGSYATGKLRPDDVVRTTKSPMKKRTLGKGTTLDHRSTIGNTSQKKSPRAPRNRNSGKVRFSGRTSSMLPTSTDGMALVTGKQSERNGGLMVPSTTDVMHGSSYIE